MVRDDIEMGLSWMGQKEFLLWLIDAASHVIDHLFHGYTRTRLPLCCCRCPQLPNISVYRGFMGISAVACRPSCLVVFQISRSAPHSLIPWQNRWLRPIPTSLFLYLILTGGGLQGKLLRVAALQRTQGSNVTPQSRGRRWLVAVIPSLWLSRAHIILSDEMNPWATPQRGIFRPDHISFLVCFRPAREARMAPEARAPSQLPLYKEADKQTASSPPSATAHEERGCYCGACCDIGNSSWADTLRPWPHREPLPSRLAQHTPSDTHHEELRDLKPHFRSSLMYKYTGTASSPKGWSDV